MDMCRKFLEMGLQDQEDMPIIETVRKYDKNRNIIPQEKDALSCQKAKVLLLYLRCTEIYVHKMNTTYN